LIAQEFLIWDKRGLRPAVSRQDIRCVALDHVTQDGAKAALEFGYANDPETILRIFLASTAEYIGLSVLLLRHPLVWAIFFSYSWA
jgi:hypothetical protein